MVDGKQVFPQMPIGEALANLDILGIEALVAIGGEGTLAAVADGLGEAAEPRTAATVDPLGRPIEADWRLLDQGRAAFVEMAAKQRWLVWD